ncbi:MAG TPA: CHASE2 domain-containing protein [Pseudoxanthomonas sp.]
MTRLKSRLLTALAAAAIVTLLVLSGLTWRADTWVYDALTRHLSRQADDRILVVAIDEKSLAELGRWPWPRRLHAQLIDRLAAAGARSVALNILLSEPALYDPEGDALLARAISKSGNVVLPVYAEAEQSDGPTVELMPIPEFAASAAALGHVDMPADDDGVVRSMFLRAGLGTPHWPSLALALSQIGDDDANHGELPGLSMIDKSSQPSPQRWIRDKRVLVPHIDRPGGGFQTVSYVDVLNGRTADSLLHGHWILIGITAAGMGNEVAASGTPAGESALSDADYQANALNMLVHGDAIVPLTPAAQVLLSIALTILPLLLFGLPHLKRIWQPILIALVLVPLAAFLLLRFAHAWFPPVPALSVLAAGGLFWIVRTLRQTRLQAQTDPLTGLSNRIRFDGGLEQELVSARRSGQPLSLLLVDVDHFKRMNDDHGHPACDEALRTLASILRARARRPRDLVARLEDDGFALLLPETTAPAAAAIATTIHVDLANLSARACGHSPQAPFTVSIGIHTARGSDQIAAEDLFEQTDAALYRAKQAGRNRSCSHTTDRGFASA